ncbi:MAG TPA: RDD family protein [Phycisphaerae bacterium]|nr:RDD family protein [Phycisphaerae bacterium]
MSRSDKSPRRPARLPGILCVVLCVAAAAQAVETPPAFRVHSAGNDQVLWLMVGQRNPQEEAYYHSLAVMDKMSAQVRSLTRIMPQKGTIGHLAVVGEELHVFYARDAHFGEDGAHYRYDRGGADRQLSLPGPVMPAAVAGESSGDRLRLWAVVSGGTAAAVRADWEKRQKASTEPAESAESAEDTSTVTASLPAVSSRPIEGPAEYGLVRYEGAAWQPGFAAPSTCAASDRLWLAAGQNRLHLLWLGRPDDRVVHYAWREKDNWVSGPDLPLDHPPGDAFAGVLNAKLIFAAIQGDAAGPSPPRLSLWVWQPGGPQTTVEAQGVWSRLPEPQVPTGELLRGSSDVALCGFLDKLVVMRVQDERPEFAFFSPLTGGPPDRPFEEVPLVGAGISRTQRNVRDLVATLVVAAVLLLVFWRRQESIATVIPLPPGVIVVGPGKRAASALIDMIPAAIVANAIWFDVIRRFVRESKEAFTSGQNEQVETPDALIWAWVCFIAVYVIWCIVFEVLWQATPGKRLMRCEVCRETAERPNAVQIVIRNISKVIELMPYLQIWPFMLVVFFTRNHQRVGDLLARTIVVEHQHVVADSGEFDDSRGQD